MAITLKQTPPSTPHDEIDLFRFDQSLLNDNPIAKQAHRRGLLTAKSSAHQQSEMLTRAGLVLLGCVLAVSFLHIFHTLAGYVPSDITPLQPPAWLWHTSAALLTLTIDAIALYIVLVGNVAAFAGHHKKDRLVWFFYGLTGLLNGVFFVSYVPGAPDWIANGLDASFATIIIVLMTLLVPVSIIAVKNAMQMAETARLKLTVECETLRGLVNEGSTTEQAQATPTTATISKPEAPAQPKLNDKQPDTPKLESAPSAGAAARPTPKPEHVPSTPITTTPPDQTASSARTPSKPGPAPAPTPSRSDTQTTRDLTQLTPKELMAQPESPEVTAEIERRVGKNVDRFTTWLNEKFATPRDTDQTIIDQEHDASKPVTTPETAIPNALDIDKAPSEALSGNTLGISGISEPQEGKPVVDRVCPKCGKALTAAQYGAARRWGHCKTCKEA